MSADLFEAFGGGNEGDVSDNQKIQSQSSAAANGSQATFFDVPGSNTFASQASPASHVTKIEPIFQPSNDGGNDVLFDAAEEVVRDDDFGDFEDVEKGHQPQPTESERSSSRELHTNRESKLQQQAPQGDQASLIDLLSIDDEQLPPTQPPLHMSADAFGEFTTITSSSIEPSSTANVVQGESADEDDGWGDFEPIDAEQSASATERFSTSQTPSNQSESFKQSPSKVRGRSAQKPVHTLNDTDDWDTFEDGQNTPLPPSRPQAPAARTTTSCIPPSPQRPTNVPPPSILLSLLPTTITSLITQILSSTQPPSLPTLVVSTFCVSARLVSTSARTLRWRRDTLLAQSTKIGAAGKSGGMKLSSLNKGESVREERDAAEAVEVWNRSVHHFSKVLSNSAMKITTSAGSGVGGGLRLSMNNAVKPLSGAGVIQSTIMCPVCGLKRSERLAGVDGGVEDVFGEYWLENWGHRECADWWYRWKDELGQR